jgi:hypothetical protein
LDLASAEVCCLAWLAQDVGLCFDQCATSQLKHLQMPCNALVSRTASVSIVPLNSLLVLQQLHCSAIYCDSPAACILLLLMMLMQSMT